MKKKDSKPVSQVGDLPYLSIVWIISSSMSDILVDIMRDTILIIIHQDCTSAVHQRWELQAALKLKPQPLVSIPARTVRLDQYGQRLEWCGGPFPWVGCWRFGRCSQLRKSAATGSLMGRGQQGWDLTRFWCCFGHLWAASIVRFRSCKNKSMKVKQKSWNKDLCSRGMVPPISEFS